MDTYIPFSIDQNRLKTHILNIEIDAQYNTNQKFQNVIFSKIHKLQVTQIENMDLT